MIDTQYAAGFFDGEGTVYIGKVWEKRPTYKIKSPSYPMIAKIGNTYKPILDQFVERWGGSIFKYQPKKKNCKVTYSWHILTNQARAFLEDIVPFLKEKRLQARFAIQFQKGKRRHGGQTPLSKKELKWYEMHRVLVKLCKAGVTH